MAHVLVGVQAKCIIEANDAASNAAVSGTGAFRLLVA
jgi:hypothetical protein